MVCAVFRGRVARKQCLVVTSEAAAATMSFNGYCAMVLSARARAGIREGRL